MDSGIHYDPERFTTALANKENQENGQYPNSLEDDMLKARTIKKIGTSEARYKMTASDLSNTWGIGLKTAQKTIQATTQRGLFSKLYPTVKRRFATGDHPLRYSQLPHCVYHNSLK